jgi:transcriptional regulator with XRE-family HTH domain
MTRNSVFEKLVGPMTIGMLLKAYQVTNDLTPEQFAKKLKLTKAELLKLESGKERLTLKDTIKIAKKLEEYKDFYALVWFQEEARSAGLDFHKYLRSHVD